MKNFALRMLRLGLATIPAVGLTLASAQQSPTSVQHVVTDWSSQRLVFGNPGTEQEALANGTHDRWLKIVNNPRYIMQQLQRHSPAQGPAAQYVAKLEQAAQANKSGTGNQILQPQDKKKDKKKEKIKKDWSESILQGAVLPNAYPATWAFDYGTPSCANDFALYPTGSAGSTSAATIIAYHNLYDTTCSGTVPAGYWAYNTGAGYTVTTSPTVSLDGTKVAFVQQNSSGSVELIVLKWVSGSGTVGVPTSPTLSTDISTCGAPCMTVSTITSSLGDTYSSPYYDYDSDALYVGDNASDLYKITGIFKGTVTPPVTSVALPNTGNTVASPVYDQGSGCLFVADSGGYLNKVNSGVAGTVCTSTSFSTNLASEQVGGIYDAPLMDSTNGTIYAFVTDTSINGCSGNCIVQYLTSFTSGSAPHGEESIGFGGFFDYLWDGSLDNVYYSSSNGTGHIYAVGNSGGYPGKFYEVPITTNTLGSPTLITTVGGNSNLALWASPVTEFCNPGTGSCAVSGGITTPPSVDYVYFSGYEVNVGPDCSSQGKGQGCVLSYNVSNPDSVSNVAQLPVAFPTSPSSSGDEGCWGTSGFVIDNGSSDTGASNIYFLNLNANSASGAEGYPVCNIETSNTIMAVQASQSELN
jgi:hypothetical protein